MPTFPYETPELVCRAREGAGFLRIVKGGEGGGVYNEPHRRATLHALPCKPSVGTLIRLCCLACRHGLMARSPSVGMRAGR